MTAKEYLEFLKQINKSSKASHSWELVAHTLEEDKKRAMLNFLANYFPNYDKSLVEPLIHSTKYGNDAFKFILGNFAKSLLHDLKELLNDDDLYALGEFDFIESGKVHAGCTNIDNFDDQFDDNKFAIYINVGTYFAIVLLVKAIIIENLQNDWAKYKKDCTNLLEDAYKIYIEHNTKSTYSIFFFDFPENIETELSSVQSATVVRILQFIALHEYGHVENGDFGIMQFHNSELVDNITNKYSTDKISEFKADIFALKKLFTDEESVLSKWGVFYSIAYYFYWLWGVEKIYGVKLAPKHPSPLDRVEYLYQEMLKLCDGNDLGYGVLLIEAKERIIKWTKQYN